MTNFVGLSHAVPFMIGASFLAALGAIACMTALLVSMLRCLWRDREYLEFGFILCASVGLLCLMCALAVIVFAEKITPILGL